MQLLFFLAVARGPVGVTMVLVSLAPVLVALGVRVVRRTRLPGAVWVGTGVAAALAWLLLGQGLGPAQLVGAPSLLVGSVLVQRGLGAAAPVSSVRSKPPGTGRGW